MPPFDIADLSIPWTLALAVAKNGDPDELVRLLRDGNPPSDSLRAELADLVASPVPRKRRRARLTPDQVRWARIWYATLTRGCPADPSDPESKPIEAKPATKVREWLAKCLIVSTDTIRDVVEGKKTYADGEIRPKRSPHRAKPRR